MNAVTMNYATTHFPTLMTQVIENSDPTFICDDSGKGVVVISQDDFEAMQETMYLLSTQANSARLQSSINELRRGQAVERELVEE